MKTFRSIRGAADTLTQELPAAIDRIDRHLAALRVVVTLLVVLAATVILVNSRAH